MTYHHPQRPLKTVCMLVISTTILTGCLSDEVNDDVAELDADNEISGSVGDGPVVGATVRVMRNDGAELAQLESDSSANYNIVVRTKGKYYPLSVDSRSGTDLVTNTSPDFDLLSAVLEPGKKTVANINPFSTFAVEMARDMAGGESKANLGLAQTTVTTQFNNGLSSLKSSGPMTTTVSGSNIAEMVRASEALGETVRRSRNAISASGFSTSGNAVVRALASDLTDDVVDGRGGPRSDARHAAVSTVVAAQVLLEAMANELHVNGVDATQAMRLAIEQVSTTIADPSLEDLTTTSEMIDRARIGLDAAYAVTSDPLIGELYDIVSDIQPNTSSQTIRTLVLPGDYRSRLDNAILLVAGGSPTVHETVNSISRDGGSDTPPTGITNSAPAISGTPATSATAGAAYSFTPNASDVDGDTLTFAVSNAPSWANFDSSTGTLSGTPANADAGSYPNIMINVTDGALTSNLPAFTITVTATTPTNSAPTISGTPATSVTAGAAYSFTPNASDADGDTLTFAVSNAPSWATFNSSTGTLSGTPADGDAGSFPNIMISVTDGALTSNLPAFTITVTATAPSNSAPQIAGSPSTRVLVGDTYTFTPSATDADGDSLTFSVNGLPSWAAFSASTGQVSGVPASGDVGTYANIRITVTDGQASVSLADFTITVDAIALGSVTLSWTPPTQNTDGTTLVDLAGYNIYWGTIAGSYPNKITIDNASVSTYVVENLAPGTYRFVATAFSTAGVESSYSGVAEKTVP